jgi:hypothetical protein
MVGLPVDREAEEALLGALLCGARVDVDLAPEDFFSDTHRAIYRALRAADSPDPIAVSAELEKRGQLPASGRSYLLGLASALPVAGNAEHWARLVREAALLREAKKIVYGVMEANEWNGTVADAANRLGELVRQGQAERDFEVLTAKELCGLPDPPESDQLLGPIVVRRSRTLIGGDTGHGKTSFALQILAAVVRGMEFLDWTGSGGRALVIDAEQGQETVKRRLREAGLEGCEAIDYLRVPDGLSLNNCVTDIAGLERLLSAGRYDVVLMDPLYKLHTGDSNAEREATDLMRVLDRWRDEYGFALFLLTHLRKTPVGGKFGLHEFFGSSAYTRGAEIALGLQFVCPGKSRLHFLKDRDGDLPTGDKWGLLFDREEGFRRDPQDGEPTCREKVKQLLEEQPGLTLEELAGATDKTERTVRSALKELDAEGSGKPKCWYLPAEELAG